MRVLGAQITVVGDETRATPAPGESFRVELPTVFPTLEGNTDGTQTLWIGCTGPDRYTGGLPLCQEFVDAALAGDVSGGLPFEVEKIGCAAIEAFPDALLQMGALSVQCVEGPPEAEFDVPDDFAADEMLFLGVVCERGEPTIDITDPLLFGCDDSDGGEIIRMHGLVKVEQSPVDENHFPSLEPFTITREGVEWLPFDPNDLPPEKGCEVAVPRDDPALHSVVPGAHKIVLNYEADAREEFEGEPENLEFTVYTTLGEMERRFTLFEGSEQGEDGVLSGELDWDPPKPSEVLPAGELVRFFFTIRDQRGGFAITERVLCLR
jgi:hypothetical protein